MSDDTPLSQKIDRFADELRGPDGYPTSEYDKLTRFAFLVEDLEAEVARLREALRAINNMGQSYVPDHFEFRSKARLIARAALDQDNPQPDEGAGDQADDA